MVITLWGIQFGGRLAHFLSLTPFSCNGIHPWWSTDLVSGEEEDRRKEQEPKTCLISHYMILSTSATSNSFHPREESWMKEWRGLGEGRNKERWKTDLALWQAGCKDALVYLIKEGGKTLLSNCLLCLWAMPLLHIICLFALMQCLHFLFTVGRSMSKAFFCYRFI